MTPQRLAFFAICFLASCVGPTESQPVGSGGEGYAARQIADDRWRVSFAGNSVTPRATVEDYLLYRAAEIARDEGALAFEVVTRETEAITTYLGAGVGAGFGIGFHRRHFGAAALPFEARPVTRYTTFAEIRLLDAETNTTNPDVYDAASVIAAIGPRLARPIER
jgi:hypothetical protein